MRLNQSNKQDLIKISLPTHYACNKIIYHEKTNFKRITRVKLNVANLYNALRRTTFCTWRHVICCRSFTNVTLLFGYFECHCTIVGQRLLGEMWTVQLPKYWNYVPWIFHVSSSWFKLGFLHPLQLSLINITDEIALFC